ncbi:MAG: outer membrane lipoprotein carrier protein LolA [Bacteroidales bacterium]|nr:outer membrane lipoprotein carrier protein LolA [Bacteroidales bacterium]
MKKTGVVMVAVLLNMVAVHAQIDEKDRVLMKIIQQANEKYTSIVSRFKQTKQIAVLGEKALSEGDFYYAKPDKLAMRYDDPAGDLLLLSGDQFVMVNAGRRKEISARSNNKMRLMKTILSSCLSGNVMQIDVEKIACEETPQYHVITAKIAAKGNRTVFTQVILSFDKTDYTLSILRTEEKDGSYTIYELTGKELNKAVDDNIFKISRK